MSVSRLRNGKWRARYRDDARKEHARHFDRKRDAELWVAEAKASMRTGTYADPSAGRITFSRFYAEWASQRRWKSTTAAASGLAARGVTFGDLPLRSIRPSHVEAWLKTLEDRGLGQGTIRTRFYNVRTVFKAALADRLIAFDPSASVRAASPVRDHDALRMPSPEQVAAVLSSAHPAWRPLFAVAAFAGMRLGEAAALQVRDIDFLSVAPTIRVQRQVQRAPGGAVEIRPPKRDSVRTVPVPTQLAELLSRHVAAHCPPATPTAWLFSVEDQPAHQNTVGHQWRKACREAGVTGFTFHSLRHFYASGLIKQNCDVATVQAALGHKNAAVTFSTYTHLWPSAGDRTRSAATALVHEVLGLAGSVRTADAH